jgi:predicted adenine nucleotide alpha hydrolase (AANH) superfamily ATPase
MVCEDKKIKLILPDWKPTEYFEVIDNKQKPARCEKCWILRLENTAKYAKLHGFTHFSSTLVTSPYQNTEKVKEIGILLAKRYGLEFYVPSSIVKELETSGFYKQFFCGCTYSLTERMTEKFKK